MGLLLCLVGLAGAAAAPQPLFPPACTVVLLAGLPGDVESENDYREQLQTWLEIVESSGHAQSLFVLSDSPEAVKPPSTIEAKVLKADRDNFLALGQILNGRTNPLTAIVWGHGGNQGSARVFHVRGPRLTPADFKSLADQLPLAESQWVLFFRGSGAFARQLAGTRRRILSSECETVFASDPVAMPLLLKLARADSGPSFEALCEQLGHATAAWYADRSLARTEEPALWIANEKPRLLISETEAESVASAKPEKTGKPAEQASSPAPEPATPGLPAAWKEITPVEPRKYPETEGVILRRRLTYTLGSSPAIVTEQDEYIQILAPEGKRFGDFDIPFSPPHEDISFLDCEVLGPDGKIARLDPDAIRETAEESAGDYRGPRRKFFSLPGVVPGAVLHVRYRTEWKRFPLPHISLEIPIGRDLPAVDSGIEVSVPKETPFHFALDQFAPSDPVIRQTGYGTTYAWHFANLPARERESLSPPQQRPRLLISTFPDWAAFAGWYARISQMTDEITPDISAKAKELAVDAKDDRARVLAVYNYVTRLRYVAVPLGVNSVRPHAAANVLKNQYGDCKDKANLLNTLLHALNIDARLVLVPRFSQARDELPGLAFNHAISRVTLGGEPVWVDTTDDICRFGMLPPGDPGRKVLVIDGQAGALTQLPSPVPGDNQLKLHGEFSCAGTPGALPVVLKAQALGCADYDLRAAAREAGANRASPPLLAARFRPVAGSFALSHQRFTPVSALNENFSWEAEGTSLGSASASGGQWLLLSPFWLPKEWDQALHSRKTPLFLNQGYPLTLEEEFDFTLPPRAQPAPLPGVSENKTGPLRWRIEWQMSGDHKLSASLRAELARGELAAADTPVLQKQLCDLLAALASGASFSVLP